MSTQMNEKLRLALFYFCFPFISTIVLQDGVDRYEHEIEELKSRVSECGDVEKALRER